MPKISKLYKEKVMPPLPKGVTIGDRTPDLEFRIRSKAKWLPVIEGLKLLPRDKTIDVDVAGLDSRKAKYILIAIKKTAKDANFTDKIKGCLLDGVLKIWSDR